MADETHITRLEEEVAHLRMTNEELSGEMHEQWKRIDALEKHIRLLETKLAGVQESLENPIENTKPPHW